MRLTLSHQNGEVRVDDVREKKVVGAVMRFPCDSEVEVSDPQMKLVPDALMLQKE